MGSGSFSREVQQRRCDMSKTILILLAFVLISGPAHSATEKPTVVACTFEKLPLTIMIFRGGMGASNNTLQVGQTPPVQLSVRPLRVSPPASSPPRLAATQLPSAIGSRHQGLKRTLTS